MFFEKNENKIIKTSFLIMGEVETELYSSKSESVVSFTVKIGKKEDILKK